MTIVMKKKNSNLNTILTNFSKNRKRLFSDMDLNLMFRMNSKIDKFIRLDKDFHKVGGKCNVVYRFACSCGKWYT